MVNRWFLCLLVLACACPFLALADESLPNAGSVLKRMLQRAKEAGDEESQYAYEKRSISEELDSGGHSTKTNEEVYAVTPIDGVPFSRLIRIQNRQLTAEELKAQDKKEQEFRRKLGQNDHHKPKPDDDVLNEALLGRYDFTVEKRDRLNDRQSLVLSFHPKIVPAPEKSVGDKVLNRLAGEVWVDEQDAEVTRVQLGLTEDLKLGWFGMIGSIKQCDVTIERQRLPEGVWVNKSFVVLLSGRKVLSPMHYRTTEDSYNFRKQ